MSKPVKSKLIAISILTMFLLIVSPSTVYGNFTEDFTNPPDNWLFYTENTTNWTNTTWEISQGALLSGGSNDFGLFNDACIKTGFDQGVYTYDFYGPSGSYRFGFRISDYPTFNSSGIPEANPLHVQVVTKIGVANNMQDSSVPPLVAISQFTKESRVSTDWFSIGLNNTNQHLSASQVRGWHHVSIEKNETTLLIFLDGLLVNSGVMLSHTNTYDSVCIWTDKGSGVMFDNISIKPLNQKPDNNLRNIIIITLSSIMGGGVIFGTRNYYKKKQVSHNLNLRKQNLEIIKKASHEFDLSNSSILALAVGTTKYDEYYVNDRYKEILPQELMAYRYLMHPIRLTIMKVLNTENQMRSVDIKHLLDISWGEYSTHIKSLEQNGYIETQNEFSENGNIIQVIYILEFGRKQYQLLFTLLQQFVAKSSPFEYLMYAQANLRDGTLYPDETGLE